MVFRPYPILTLFTLALLAGLIWLGTWQLQRAQWKTQLIADFEKASAAEPVSLDDALCGSGNPLHRLVASHRATGPVLRVFGQDKDGTAGWRRFQASPGCVAGAGQVLVETGFEPQVFDAASGPATIRPWTGRYILQAFPPKPMIASANSPSTNEWIWFDAKAMASALGLTEVDHRYILTALNGLPDYLATTPPSRHVGYAVTWYGMALGLLVVYALFHMRAGRLRFFSRAKSGP
jgi:surfeit locus 1 family protein